MHAGCRQLSGVSGVHHELGRKKTETGPPREGDSLPQIPSLRQQDLAQGEQNDFQTKDLGDSRSRGNDLRERDLMSLVFIYGDPSSHVAISSPRNGPGIWGTGLAKIGIQTQT